MKPEENEKFVADGYGRLRRAMDAAGIDDDIRQRVEEKYQTDLAKAGLFKEMLLRFRIRREIAQALDEIAPREGLYIHTE